MFFELLESDWVFAGIHQEHAGILAGITVANGFLCLRLEDVVLYAATYIKN